MPKKQIGENQIEKNRNKTEIRKETTKRKFREEIEKQKAKERYMKLHLEGKTEQARADLARLAIIKKQREDAAKKRDDLKKGEKAHVYIYGLPELVTVI